MLVFLTECLLMMPAQLDMPQCEVSQKMTTTSSSLRIHRWRVPQLKRTTEVSLWSRQDIGFIYHKSNDQSPLFKIQPHTVIKCSAFDNSLSSHTVRTGHAHINHQVLRQWAQMNNFLSQLQGLQELYYCTIQRYYGLKLYWTSFLELLNLGPALKLIGTPNLGIKEQRWISS